MNTGEKKKIYRIWKAKCFHQCLSIAAAAAAGGGEEGSGRTSLLISGAGGRKHPVETAEKGSKTGQRLDPSHTEQCVLKFRLHDTLYF